MPLDLSQAASAMLARRQRQREVQQNGHQRAEQLSARTYSGAVVPRQPRPKPKARQPPAYPPPSQYVRGAARPTVKPPEMPPPKHLLIQQRSRVAANPYQMDGPPSQERWRVAEPRLRPTAKSTTRPPRSGSAPAPPPPPRRPATAQTARLPLPRHSPWAYEEDEFESYVPATSARPSTKRPWQNSGSTVPRKQTAPPAQFPKDVFLQIWLGDDVEIPEFLEGLPTEGLAFSMEGKKANLCLQADEILGRYFEEPEESITYSEGNNQVDDSYERFPEVGAALRGHVANLKECFCIAKSDFHQIWAVGVSEKGRNRYQASRIALAATLVSQSLDADEEVDMSSTPAFAALVNTLRTAGTEEAPAPQPAQKKQKLAAHDEPESEAAEPVETTTETRISTLPRDVPFVISFADEPMPSVLDGLPSQAIAVSSDGKKKGLYSSADSLLSHLAGEAAADIEYLDDPRWEDHPEMGTVLKKIADAEECFVIAISRIHDVWALGVGMRSASRHSASKLALATVLAMSAQDAGDPVDLSEFQQFDAFVQEAYAALSAADEEP